jgi:hypothetical protein
LVQRVFRFPSTPRSDVKVIVGNVEDEVELFEDFAAQHAHFLRANRTGKKARVYS